MDQRAFLALTAMLNSFPQGSGNPDLTMGTYEAVLSSVSSQAIVDAAQRFTAGDVPDQNRAFAPSVAEFVQQARKQDEYLAAKARPRIPYSHTVERMPFMLRIEKKRAEYADRALLFTDVNFDTWKRLSREGQVPVGGVWVSSLGTVYGPKVPA